MVIIMSLVIIYIEVFGKNDDDSISIKSADSGHMAILEDGLEEEDLTI